MKRYAEGERREVLMFPRWRKDRDERIRIKRAKAMMLEVRAFNALMLAPFYRSKPPRPPSMFVASRVERYDPVIEHLRNLVAVGWNADRPHAEFVGGKRLLYISDLAAQREGDDDWIDMSSIWLPRLDATTRVAQQMLDNAMVPEGLLDRVLAGESITETERGLLAATYETAEAATLRPFEMVEAPTPVLAQVSGGLHHGWDWKRGSGSGRGHHRNRVWGGSKPGQKRFENREQIAAERAVRAAARP